MKLQKLFLFFFLINSFVFFSQERAFKGVVKDSLQQRIEYANIMAKPTNVSLPFIFALSNQKGEFELRLSKKSNYQVTVSFMGYESYVFKIDSLKRGNEKLIILKPSTQLLDEVVIVSKTPMKVTKDSIIYNVKAFTNGKEFKLKSVLKKLPGVEVDRDGQIKVLGTKISQVFVDNKPFFGGSSKLAVDNLPANVIEQIQVVKDYNQVGFMKGLNDNQQMIINIKLKEGKKRFVFGDVVAGSNEKKNYLAKANLFYYSPKTNLSYIGNSNDIGLKSLNYSDVRRFENRNLNFDNTGVNRTTTSPLLSFSRDENFMQRKNLFNALQWQQDVGDKWDFSVFGVSSKRKTDYKDLIKNTYLTNTPTEETIDNDRNSSQSLNFSKWTLNYKPSIRQYFKYALLFNKNVFSQSQLINRVSPVNSNRINYLNDNKGISIKQDFSWYKKFDKKNIVKLVTNVAYDNQTPLKKWLSDKPILGSFLSLTPQNDYEIWQNRETKTATFDFLFKYYYKLNAKNHLYFSVGNNNENHLFKNNLQQITTNGIVNFNDFENDYRLKINDFYVGLQYRFKLWGGLYTPGVYVHQVSWDNSYTNQVKKKNFLLPKFDFELETFGKIKFNYQLKILIPNVQKFSYNNLIQSFQTLYKGNVNLTNELFHDMNLNYSFGTFASRIYFYYNLSYSEKLTSIKNSYIISGVNSYITPVELNRKENTLDTGFSFSKSWRKFYVRYAPLYSFSRYFEFVNNQLVLNRSTFFTQNLVLGMRYQNYPEIELGVEQTIYTNEVENNVLKVTSYNPFASVVYNYRNFTFTSDYKINFLKRSLSVENAYHFLDITLTYQKENNPFGAEISVTNLLNNNLIENYAQSSYLYTNNFVFTQPRILMLKLLYKL